MNVHILLYIHMRTILKSHLVIIKKTESPFLDIFSTSTGEEEGAGRVEMSVRGDL